jgi:uncharacterized protein YbaA (DUF1428 family)
MITSEIRKKEDSQIKSFVEMEKIISALANVDALKVFYAAGEGIKSSTEAIKTLGLTQKRYYTHLRNLMEAGLIEKSGETYQHTTLGKISHKMGEAFQNALSQRDRLDLVDRLGKAKNISIEETEEIMRAILKQANIGSEGRLTDFTGPVRVADNWEKVVYDVEEYLDKAQDDVYFATRYFDIRTAEAIMRTFQRGVKFYALWGSKEPFIEKAKMVMRTVIFNPKMLKSFFKFLSSANLNMRIVDIPYTFIVVDKKYAMIEVAKPYTHAFSMAFFFHNEKLCERLIETFEMLWKKGTEVGSLLDMISK